MAVTGISTSAGSPPDESGYTMQAVHDHLTALTELLDLSDVIVAGHSRGARPSTLVDPDPERVRSPAIVDSNPIAPRPTRRPP